MRSLAALFVALLGLGGAVTAQTTPCVGLACQQVSCPAGGPSTTSISGVVYAPNGTDPLPNVLVYVPNAPLGGFTPGVSCPVVGAPPDGSPLVGATTAVDGSFTIPDMPVGTNIPLVIVSGRWRRQLLIPSVSACGNTALPQGFASFPSNHTQGDIPFIALATGSADSVECVLRKVGISDSEFTDPGGGGRINIYLGNESPGASLDAATPSENALMENASTLNSYDVLMLPCEGSASQTPDSTQLANLIAFTNAGGRVYSSHFSYRWMYTNPPFNKVVNWIGSSSTLPDGIATVNASFSGGATLSQWLVDVGASTTPGQIAISTIKHDFNGVNPPTEDWLNLDASGNPVMQFVFDTPVGSTGNQCGRVLFNEYHVENPTISSTGRDFPTECPAAGTPLTPQEKLLEYSLFELTNNGSAATLTPTTQDFGTSAIGFNSPVQTFVWTNKSTFTASVTLLTGSTDFNLVGSNPCTSVLPGSSCNIQMVFNPSVIGAETGTLTVGSNGSTLTATLTGTGIPDLTITPAQTLNFGNLDVGASATLTLTATNSATGTVPVPGFLTTGDYSTTNNCGSTLAAGASCTITVKFTPTTSGTRTGTLTVNAANPGTPSMLTGNGLDFTIASSPASGTAIAGYSSSTMITTTPLAGFGAQLKLSCTTQAPGSICTLTTGTSTASTVTYESSSPTQIGVSITTTAQYAVIGYTGGFGSGWLSLIAVASASLLWMRRRSLGRLARSGLTLALLAVALGAASLGMTGCSGKLPAKNANYTVPGNYTYTMTATDGIITHSATYTLTVTAK
jgi:hypothetical protein